jgi:hypothetical protein
MLLEVRLAQPASTGAIRSRLTAAGLGDSVIQIFDDPRDVLIRTHGTHPDPTELSRRIIGALPTDGTSAPEIRRLESVGPQIGDELRKQAVYAVLAALLGILLFSAHRTDVVVLGHETHFRFETQDQPDATLAVMLRQSPRPVVVVPRELPEAGGIVVAHGGGREAAHTLQTYWGLTDTIYCAISSPPRSRARFFALARSRCSLAPESPRGGPSVGVERDEAWK